MSILNFEEWEWVVDMCLDVIKFVNIQRNMFILEM